MANIIVKPLDANSFEVIVEAASTTTHVVSVSADYAAMLTGRKTSSAELVRLSFQFLLEREPNTSILRRFDLPVIARYFPEYERVIKTLL